MAEQIVFYVLSGLTVLGALAVIVPPFARNPLHAAVALLATFSLLAGLFVMLSAHLLAILQILVYAGAVMVLFVFVIMLLNLRREDLGGFRVTSWKILGGVAAFLVAVRVSMVAGAAVSKWTPADLDTPALKAFGGVHEVGMALTTRFFLPFEVTSILLLVAIIGALVVARREGGAR
jgi:NADH-quinone oxidoreductase subunit J